MTAAGAKSTVQSERTENSNDLSSKPRVWEEFEGRGKELTNVCCEETGIRIVNDESEIPEDER